ncbi:MAG TPA: hypothetical protein VFV49_16315, partial [Thermoanaerobaculia bacterium]|nr:hypothetical protein [Thermoanaerobaculia bacterium]
MTKRRKVRFAALWTALTMFPVLALADVRICNRGEVDLEVLRLKTFRFQTLLSWDIEGWISVPPADCKQISYGDGYTHIVFAVEGSNGKKVVVQYEPEKSTLPDSVKIKDLCVRQEDIEDSGWNSEAKLPTKYLPPCEEGFTAAPTSATALIYGNARMWLTISPKADDWKRSKPAAQDRRHPAKLLESSDPREFLASWYLATRTVTSLSEGERRAASMLRIVGPEAFNRAVAAARAGKLQPEGLELSSEFDPVLMRAELNREAYMDWLATKHDPGLYVLYLIKRSTYSDWDYAAALLRAR